MDAESLLRVPLVRQMLEDSRVALIGRGVDHRWRYRGFVRDGMGGFNPYVGAVFYPRKSALAEFLRAPEASARRFNLEDRLVHELMFAVHDYLHVWAVGVLAAAWPQLGIGECRITLDNLDDLAFCHLLTEAAATVGLDYWYLAEHDLNDVVPIGTSFRTLAITYHGSHAAECRRFRPDLDTGSRAFFDEVARFYVTGRLPGFSQEHLRQSPILLRWLRHELSYAERQREYIRCWLAFMGDLPIDPRAASRPLALDEEWKMRAISLIGDALWRKVRAGVDDGHLAVPSIGGWASAPTPNDFRFINANTVDREALHATLVEAPREHAMAAAHQYISSFEFDSIDSAVLPQIRDALREGALGRLPPLFVEGRCLEPDPREPRDLMVLG